MSQIAFVGPSLPRSRVESLLPVSTIRPPAQRGDVHRAVRDGATSILLVDGYFDTTPAVWHKELLDALARGVHVVGCSSMGALRAVEMEPFGMIGVGEVFAAVRRGELDDDDVVVAHDPEEQGCTPRSVAMVNIRWTLRSAVRDGVLSEGSAADLDATAKSMYYPHRHYSAIVEAAAAIPSIGPRASEKLGEWILHNAVDVKAADAVEAARTVAPLAEAGSPLAARRPGFPATRFYLEFLAEEEELSDSRVDNWSRSVLDELRVDPDRFRGLLREADLRQARIEAARLAGVNPDQEMIDRVSDAFRRDQGLLLPEQLAEWLEEMGWTDADYSEFINREALARWGARQTAAAASREAAILDLVRIEGVFADLSRSAETRARDLRRQGLDETGSSIVSGGTLDDLRDRFEERYGAGLRHMSEDELCDHLALPGPDALRIFLRVMTAGDGDSTS